MSPTLVARVDGLPSVLLERERVWPASDKTSGIRRPLSAKARARIERQTAVVHAAALPRSAHDLVATDLASDSPYLDVEAERSEIQAALEHAGLR